MSTPEILSKLGIGSGLNNSEIISAIVDAETIAEKEKIAVLFIDKIDDKLIKFKSNQFVNFKQN